MTPERKAMLQSLINRVMALQNELSHGLLAQATELRGGLEGGEPDFVEIDEAFDNLDNADTSLIEAIESLQEVMDYDADVVAEEDSEYADDDSLPTLDPDYGCGDCEATDCDGCEHDNSDESFI
jgi:hypothetical protein